MPKFDDFIEAIKQHMQPEGRAQDLAGSLQQLLEITSPRLRTLP